ncbi:MAG: hypothetical protein JRJ23_04595 [Deltaproteobacteria bacterium]|nr:hypothetical protein [Deltaproteobacteria bacterium]MBW1914557.1 hypothetical protein [Deltaproteobacteria bacterium]
MNGSPPIKIQPDQKESCCNIKIPTDDELFALNKMREIRSMVQKLKSRLLKSDKDTDMKSDLEAQISALKEEWKGWEQKRDAAARERMRILGHENSEF